MSAHGGLSSISARKRDLRRSVLASRAALSEVDLEHAGRALAAGGSRLVLGGPAGAPTHGCVAAYVSTGSEPPTRPLIDALHAAGVRVLLPVLCTDGDLDWAAYEGPDALRPSAVRSRLEEPAGRALGRGSVADAGVVLVPALAVDRSGRRLGRGGGSYDRALLRAGAEARLVAVLHDGEVLDDVPAEPHDVPVDAVLLPGGYAALNRSASREAAGGEGG